MSDEETYLLENLHKLSEEYFDQSFGRCSEYSQSLIEERNSREKIRRESDRYTLEEAAFFVGSRVNALPESILKKLIKAVGDGSLIVDAPGRNERSEPDHAYVQGCYEEAYGADLNDWFEKNKGIAIGIVAAGGAAGQGIIPFCARLLITDYSWQDAYLFLAIGYLIIGVPVALPCRRS